MNYLMILFYILHFYASHMYCHGDHGDKPKSILISVILKSTLNSFNSIKSKFSFISIPLKVIDINSTFDSILNGCYKKYKAKCEPIWVTNQRNSLESAIIDWPNQLVYNETIWPTFSFGCNLPNVSLNLKLNRLKNWMERPKTSLGIIYITYTDNNDKFLSDFISKIHNNSWNLIVITFDKIGNVYEFLALGSKFVRPNNSISIVNEVDIKLLIEKVLDLKTFSNEGLPFHSDGNVGLVSILTGSVNRHNKLGFLKFVYISTIIGSAVIMACTFVIVAIKSSCITKQKVNHQYSLGLNDITSNTGYPENTYLLNASDDDELFSDAMPTHSNDVKITASY